MTDTPLVDCSAGYGVGPFKYGYCHEGMCGPCCAPRVATIPVMTWPQWRTDRSDTIFLFETIGTRSTDRAIIIYDKSGREPCYDRVDAVTRLCC